ncbi:MAG: hypothetical protein ACR2HN_03405 [Tepidiformaceae bacterium]
MAKNAADPESPSRHRWEASATEYRYGLREDDHREILAYHWHPGQRRFGAPHLHVSAAAGRLRPELQRAHLPTARVALEQFLLMLIRDFHVAPQRTDYEGILSPLLTTSR